MSLLQRIYQTNFYLLKTHRQFVDHKESLFFVSFVEGVAILARLFRVSRGQRRIRGTSRCLVRFWIFSFRFADICLQDNLIIENLSHLCVYLFFSQRGFLCRRVSFVEEERHLMLIFAQWDLQGMEILRREKRPTFSMLQPQLIVVIKG